MRRAWAMSQGGSLHPAQQLCSKPGVSCPPCSNNRLSNSTAPTCFAWGYHRCWSCTCSTRQPLRLLGDRPSHGFYSRAGESFLTLEHEWTAETRVSVRPYAQNSAQGFCRVQKFNGGDILNCTIGEVYSCLEKVEIWKRRLRDSTESVNQKAKKKNKSAWREQQTLLAVSLGLRGNETFHLTRRHVTHCSHEYADEFNFRLQYSWTGKGFSCFYLSGGWGP